MLLVIIEQQEYVALNRNWKRLVKSIKKFSHDKSYTKKEIIILIKGGQKLTKNR